MPSFTVSLPNLQQEGPVVEVKLVAGAAAEDAERKANRVVPAPLSVQAMIDTGASGTVIRQDIPEKLGLKPIGKVLINTPSSTGVECYKYLIRLMFPNNVFGEFLAIAAPLQGQSIQCLVGRDVLCHAVLVYTGNNNSFTLCF
jgi:predicted aspartyl protease